MRTVALMLVIPLAACGGKSKPAEPTATSTSDGESDPANAEGGDVVPPDRMDEIKSLLDRKRTAASRCLADAVNSGAVPKNAHGHVALEFTIGTDGAATGMKVIESSIDSSVIEQCVMAKVQQIDFGALPAPLEWSYTYAFESM